MKYKFRLIQNKTRACCDPTVSYGDSDEFIRMLEDNGAYIYGGDILIKAVSGMYDYSGDNWYYNGGDASESIETAKSYLEEYLNKEVAVAFCFTFRPEKQLLLLVK